MGLFPLLRGLVTTLLLLGLGLVGGGGGGGMARAAYASPGACSGDCWAHDPAMIKRAADGTYFRFNTGGGVRIYKASSIAGSWTYEGDALPAGSSIDLSGNTDLWAPMVILVGSTYYLYYSVSTFGSQSSAIGYATSDTMEYGSWVDHGSTGVSSSSGKPYNAIDPTVVQSAEGAYYMTFGSFWGDIYQVAMTNPPTAASGSSYQLAYNASGAHAEEGSFIYLRGTTGYYYLFFSAGTCCGYDASRPAAGEEYSIRVCRSTNIAGPYVDANGVACASGGGTIVLASSSNVYGPGGQGIMVDANQGGAVLYYHYVNTNIGYGDGDKQFGWNGISWSTGWPVAY